MPHPGPAPSCTHHRKQPAQPGLVPVSADSPGARRVREVGKRLQVGRQVEPGQAPGQSVHSALPVPLLRAVGGRKPARERGELRTEMWQVPGGAALGVGMRVAGANRDSSAVPGPTYGRLHRQTQVHVSAQHMLQACNILLTCTNMSRHTHSTQTRMPTHEQVHTCTHTHKQAHV